MKSRYVLLTGILALLSSAAFAGLLQPQVVVVDTAAMMAQGDMVTARYSDNDVEFIGCGIRTLDDGAGGAVTFGFCQATDSEGVDGFCSSFNTDLLLAMAATADFSFITFNWDAAGECTRIGFSTQSFYLPDGLVSDDDDDSDSDSD